jgi:Spherulation-specific family 4
MKLHWILTTILTIGCSMSCSSRDIDRQDIVAGSTVRNSPHQPNSSELMQAVINRSNPHSKLQILLPLYIYPNWYDKHKYVWKQVIIAAKKVPIVVIINPNNGSNGAPPNPDYQQGIKDLHQAGVKILGYVPSNYANRDLQAVKADIDVYLQHFKIDGIFIDEAASKEDKFNYYQQLYQYIKSRSPHISTKVSSQYQVVINPGTSVDEIYLKQPVADLTVIFENYQKVWADYHPPTYIKNYSSQHFAALVHTTANRKLMKSILDRAVKYNFGYVYITNDSTDTVDRNPWDSLPEYWQSQVNYIQKINANQ